MCEEISEAILPTISGEMLSVLPGSRRASPLDFNMALLKERPGSPIHSEGWNSESIPARAAKRKHHTWNVNIGESLRAQFPFQLSLPPAALPNLNRRARSLRIPALVSVRPSDSCMDFPGTSEKGLQMVHSIALKEDSRPSRIVSFGSSGRTKPPMSRRGQADAPACPPTSA